MDTNTSSSYFLVPINIYQSSLGGWGILNLGTRKNQGGTDIYIYIYIEMDTKIIFIFSQPRLDLNVFTVLDTFDV